MSSKKRKTVTFHGVIGISPGDFQDIVNGETTIGFKYDGIGCVFGCVLIFLALLMNIFLFASKYLLLLSFLYFAVLVIAGQISMAKKDYETYIFRRFLAIAGSPVIALVWFCSGGITGITGYIWMIASVSYNSFLVTGKKGKWYVSYAIVLNAAAMLLSRLCPQLLLPIANEQHLMWHNVISIIAVCIYIGLTTWFQRKIAENVQDKLADANKELTRLNREIEHHMQEQMEMKIQEEKLKQEKKQTEETTLLLVQTLSSTIEARDEYLRGHSGRVSRYSGLIAEKMGLGKEEVEALKTAAVLHDIGKIGVSDRILDKPSKLTEEEYETIKSHCRIGSDILKDISFISYTADIARHHHERYDGTGYPDGLKGEEISLGARIVAVADSFDAMNSRRVYRKPLDRETIRSEIVKNRGSQFDPSAADAFLELYDSGAIDEADSAENA